MRTPASAFLLRPPNRPVRLLFLAGLLALPQAARAGFVVRVQTPGGDCPEQLQVTLDGVPARVERKPGCDWWMMDDAEEALLTVRAAGYLDEIRRLDAEPHPDGMVAVRLTPSGDLLPGMPDDLPAAEAAGHGSDGHGHSHGGDEAVAAKAGAGGGGSGDGISGTVALRWRPDAWQADAIAPGGAFGRTVNNRLKTTGLEMNLRTALFKDRLFLRATYSPIRWTTRAEYQPPAQPGVDGLPATGPRSDILAPQTDQAYGLELRWLPTPAHELTASYNGAYFNRLGMLHGAGDRQLPSLNPGLEAIPNELAPQNALRGSAHSEARTISLGYTFRFRRFEAGIWGRNFSGRYHERPAPEADSPLYLDWRRDQVHVLQVLNDFKPVVPLEQVRFGGFGLFTDVAGADRRTWGARLAGRFGAANWWTAELRAQRASATLSESLLRSGYRGEQGVMIFLSELLGGPVRETFVRIQGGVTGGVICRGRMRPRGADLLQVCPNHKYLISRGEIGPPAADLRVTTDRVELLNRWQWRRQSLSVALEARRDEIVDPTDYTLLGALTGTPLIGANGYPVGTYDPDVPPDSFVPKPLKLLAGPGRFIGGRQRFPLEPGWKIEWQKQLGESDRLTASWARVPEDVPGELQHHLFEASFTVGQASYQYPDLTANGGLAFAGGGAVSYVAPGTRLASHEDFRLAWQSGGWLPVGLTVELFQRRQNRILAHTQINSLENVVNRAIDTFLYSDANYGTRYCLNCQPGQTSAFPDHVPGMQANGEPNPDSRGILSLILANPGHNTDPALFGYPKRISRGIRFAAIRQPSSGGRLTARLSGQWSRSHGNFEGLQFVGDDQEHAGPRSIFNYPVSPMTRSQYASGALPEEFPTFARLDLRVERLGFEGLSAALSAEWHEGSLRTPWLSLPLSSLTGNIPGSAPDYYRIDTDLDGYADRVLLRNFTPLRRGALGRNDSQFRFDAALLYRHSRGRIPWRAGFAVINVLNSRPVATRDDRLEVPASIYRDVAPSGQNATQHVETAAEISTRIPNPDFGRPFRQTAPRTVQFLFALDF